ncbi:MAG: hypothetical protein ACRDEA_23635 [Microcystaceae cyanobacterium]
MNTTTITLITLVEPGGTVGSTLGEGISDWGTFWAASKRNYNLTFPEIAKLPIFLSSNVLNKSTQKGQVKVLEETTHQKLKERGNKARSP